MAFQLRLLPETFAVCRFPADADVPSWATGEFVSITRTAEELSIVCAEEGVPGDVRAERDWRCFQLQGPIAFTETGVIAGLTAPLADAGIGVFVVSTFDTDYVLVKSADVENVARLWRHSGRHVEQASRYR